MNASFALKAKPPLAYYNEIDPYLCEWLSNLSDAGTIPHGVVDPRSIRDVQPDDLEGFQQVHFFAGLGTWGFASLLAGWPIEEELWTASCPCQPFSNAGQRRGFDDPRHLWPDVFRLVRARRPAVLVGEQVAAAAGQHWLDGVFADLEGIGYACRAVVLPACAVNAPHRRDRLWFVAIRDGVVGDRLRAGLEGFAGDGAAARGWPAEDGPAPASGRGDAVGDTDRVGGQIDPHAGGCEGGSSARAIAGSGGADDGAVADADQPGAGEGRLQRRGQLSGLGGDPRGGAGPVPDADERRRLGRTDLAQRPAQGRTAAAGFGDGPPGQALADATGTRDSRRRVCGSGEGAGADGQWASGQSGRRDQGIVADPQYGGCDRTRLPAPPQHDLSGNPWAGGRIAPWSEAGWIVCHDGKARRIPEPRIRLLADGVPARIPKLRAAGNAIVPQLAAEVLRALHGG